MSDKSQQRSTQLIEELRAVVSQRRRLGMPGYMPGDSYALEARVADALTESAARNRELTEALEEVVHEFNLWNEDANDGTYAYWKSDGLMSACVKARAVLTSPKEQG